MLASMTFKSSYPENESVHVSGSRVSFNTLRVAPKSPDDAWSRGWALDFIKVATSLSDLANCQTLLGPGPVHRRQVCRARPSPWAKEWLVAEGGDTRECQSAVLVVTVLQEHSLADPKASASYHVPAGNGRELGFEV